MDRLFTDENGVPVEEVQQYENYEWVENQFVVINGEHSGLIGRYTNGRIIRLQYYKNVMHKK